MTKDYNIIHLNVVLTCELLVDFIDELKGTSEFRQTLKSKAKSLEAEIEPILAKNLQRFYDVDEEMTVNTMRNFKELILNISTLGTNELLLINEVIKDYKANKDIFEVKYPINLTKLNS